MYRCSNCKEERPATETVCGNCGASKPGRASGWEIVGGIVIGIVVGVVAILVLFWIGSVVDSNRATTTAVYYLATTFAAVVGLLISIRSRTPVFVRAMLIALCCVVLGVFATCDAIVLPTLFSGG
jgi:hypothetical protein